MKLSIKNAMLFYNISKTLSKIGLPIVPKFIDLSSRLIFNCWVPHTAKIGKNVVLAYGGMSIVIHSNAVIGDNVEVGQGVTIGGNAREKGEPIIEDNVYIGSGAKILGPITIGSGAIIGANSVVLNSLPKNVIVVGVPARIIKRDININEYLYHRKKR